MSDRSTDRMKLAALYREAAALYENGKLGDPGRGSCCAITQAMNPKMHHYDAYDSSCRTKAVLDYREMFSPGNGVIYWGREFGDSIEEQDAGRALALCLMAAMVEAGDA